MTMIPWTWGQKRQYCLRVDAGYFKPFNGGNILIQWSEIKLNITSPSEVFTNKAAGYQSDLQRQGGKDGVIRFDILPSQHFWDG